MKDKPLQKVLEPLQLKPLQKVLEAGKGSERKVLVTERIDQGHAIISGRAPLNKLGELLAAAYVVQPFDNCPTPWLPHWAQKSAP